MRPIIAALAALVLLLPGAASASRALPAGSGLLRSAGEAPRYQLSSSEVDAVLAQAEEEAVPAWDDGSAGAPRRWWPLLLSAAVPGLGEAVTGYKRGYALIAVDAASWYGVYHYQNEGDDKEEEYLAFADAHWSLDRWRSAIEGDEVDESQWFGTNYATIEDVPLYVTREEDEREYYENLGKWDIFWYGWEDSRPTSIIDPEVPWDWNNPPQEFLTPLRDQYLDLRKDSNDAYETRDRLLTLNLLTRVLSVLQVAYLEGFIGGRYDNDYEGPGLGASLARVGGEEGALVSFFATPRGLHETRLGLQVRY
jgi:hypothetical protein